MKRSSAFSRIEQVLNRIRSASAARRRLAVPERFEHPLHPLASRARSSGSRRSSRGSASSPPRVMPRPRSLPQNAETASQVAATRGSAGTGATVAAGGLGAPGVKPGSASSTRAPRPPAGAATRTSPPCASAIARTIASPRPGPPDERERAGVGPVEPLEHALSVGLRNPGPVVDHGEARRPPGSAATSSRTSPVPGAVWSIALRPRLRSAWARRSGSARSVPAGIGPSSKLALGRQAEAVPQLGRGIRADRSAQAAGSRPARPRSAASGRRPGGSSA